MSIEISMVMAVWNTAHLLKRSVETYLKQTLDPERWELIVINDRSPDDVLPVLKPLEGKLNLRYLRLDHRCGMRGNTVSFNTAFALARGAVLAETTPECLLPPDALERLLAPHADAPDVFVALKTYNLKEAMQLRIDSVDWHTDIMNCRHLRGWKDEWVQHNVPITHFGTHQICSIRKETFYHVLPTGFPLFLDYGSDDPHYCGQREKFKVKDITLPNDCMAIHQWHPPFQYWMSKGHAPNLNKFAHSMKNYLDDATGFVPAGGTCVIWDHNSHELLSEEEKAKWAQKDDNMIAMGVPEGIVKHDASSHYVCYS